MKVLLISYRFYPCRAVGARRWSEFYELSKNYKDLDFTVLTANWTGEKLKDENIHYLGKELIYSPPKSINRKITAVDIIKHPSISTRSIDKSVFSSWYRHAKEWIKQNNDKKFDLIIASYGPMASVLLGSFAKNVLKIPFILDLRDLISIQGQKKKLFILDSIDRKIDKYFTRNVDSFLTVSPTCEQKAKNFYERDVITIYNGMQEIIKKDFQLNITNKDKVIILYMGTLGISRNPSHILDIFEQYTKNNREVNFEFRFASQDNPISFLIENDIKNISVKWLGYLSKDELAREQALSDAFLLLEDQTEKGNENLTGKLFEYMLLQKPILVSCNIKSDIVNLINHTKLGMHIETVSEVEKFLSFTSDIKKDTVNFYSRSEQFEYLINKGLSCIKN